MKRKRLIRLMCSLVATALAGCVSESAKSHPEPAPEAEAAASDSFLIEGTVVFVDLEGGFYAIHGDDGQRYDPVNLPEAFQQDGLAVQLEARLKEDAMSFHMYGRMIEILEIEEGQ